MTGEYIVNLRNRKVELQYQMSKTAARNKFKQKMKKSRF
jgi:hypothetical protein